MRGPTLLAILLVASASSAVALHGPQPTPSPHLVRRNANHGVIHPRSPRPAPQGGLGGLLGGSVSSASGSDSSRQNGGSSNDGSGTGTTSSSTTSAAPTSTSTTSARPTSSTTSSSTTAAPSSTSTVTSVPTSTSAAPTSVVQETSTVSASLSTSTDTAGAAETSAAAGSSSEETTSSSHTGLIVGVSVVGGVALLGALIFLYMKFGGRRFSDFQDDDADIKWPELKHDDNAAAMQPLPARRTGGAGFDMGDDSDMGHGGREGDDLHSLNNYGGKGHDALAASSTALNAPSAHAGYGYDDGATAYGSNMGGGASAHHGSVGGYYDPYGQFSATGHEGLQPQQHAYYPDQQHGHYGGPPSYAAGGYGGASDYGTSGAEYGRSGDAGAYDGGYGSHSAHTSPAAQPYRVGGHTQGSRF